MSARIGGRGLEPPTPVRHAGGVALYAPPATSHVMRPVMGMVANWLHRYAPIEARSVYNPAPQKRPIRKIPNRPELVAHAAEILKRGGEFPFAYEGVLRFAIRAALCRRRWKWNAADGAAEAVIEDALARLGIRRPTWQEGQPEITAGGIRCQRCSNELGEDAIRSASIFCGPECAKATLAERRLDWAWRNDAQRSAAEWVFLRETFPARPCDHCKALFRPTKEGARFCSKACSRASRGDLIEERDCTWCGKSFVPGQRADAGAFCSLACYTASRAVPSRPCAHCGTVFKPHSAARAGKFCSVSCANAARVTVKERPCIVCGTPFRPDRPADQCCSAACRKAHRAATVTATCPQCRTEFSPPTRRAIYCSRQCKDRARQDELRARRKALAAAAHSDCTCGGQCGCTAHHDPP